MTSIFKKKITTDEITPNLKHWYTTNDANDTGVQCKEITQLELCEKREDCMVNKSKKCQKIPKKNRLQQGSLEIPTPTNVISSKKVRQRHHKSEQTRKKKHSEPPEQNHEKSFTQPPKPEPKPSSKPSSSGLPAWYRIPEIKPNDFIFCVKGIYSVLEKKHQNKAHLNCEDPFIKAVVTGFYDMNNEKWAAAEAARMSQKVLEMKIGDFHEELMGKIPGYETYKNGHITGCDVGSIDGREIYEVKNKNNTTKGSDGKHIIETLTKLLHQGKHPIFAQINCPNGKVARFNAPKGVDVWNGRKTYHHMTGRETFFDDLEHTTKFVFSHYKTLDELKQALETS
jgi:hypothetical protein